jgi:hypothetical protein
MKIIFEMSGGFAHIPMLSKPISFDTKQIDPEVANEIESFVRNSDFFDQHAQTDTVAKGAADYRTYTITIEDDSRVHTIQLAEPIQDANLERLVSRLQSIARQSKP